MGGTIILVSIMASALLWANFKNNYVWLTIFVILSLGAVGFIDDYRKVILKDKRGLPGRWKFFWQAMIGIAAAVFLYTSDFDTVIAIPFFKGARLDMGLLYIPFVAFIIVGSSNAVNLTDGLDGLAIGPMVIAAGTYMLFAYFAGHVKIAAYLQIPYVAGAGELTVIAAAMVGASLGFYGSTPTRRRYSWETSALSPWAAGWASSRSSRKTRWFDTRRRHIRHGGAFGHISGRFL